MAVARGPRRRRPGERRGLARGDRCPSGVATRRARRPATSIRTARRCAPRRSRRSTSTGSPPRCSPARSARLARTRLGDALALDLDQCWVRRQYAPAHAPAGPCAAQLASGRRPRLRLPRHDARAEGALLAMVTCWIALTPCGADAPGIEFAGGDADATCCRSPPSPTPRSAPAIRERDRLRPVLAAGDALVFGGGVLHHTHVAADHDPRPHQPRAALLRRRRPAAAAARRSLPVPALTPGDPPNDPDPFAHDHRAAGRAGGGQALAADDGVAARRLPRARPHPPVRPDRLRRGGAAHPRDLGERRVEGAARADRAAAGARDHLGVRRRLRRRRRRRGARARRRRDQHARRPQRRGRRPGDRPGARGLAPHPAGRPLRARRPVGERADAAGAQGQRRAARHRRPRPDRQRDRQAGRGLRHDDRLHLAQRASRNRATATSRAPRRSPPRSTSWSSSRPAAPARES